jgi:predicted ATPase/class 3 adenylate cyclase
VADDSSATLTFVFSDIEGSTKLLQALGPAYADVLAEHDRIIRSSATEHGGRAFGSEGDAQNLVFAEAGAAVRAALAAQQALARQAWPEGNQVRVRMGIHSGQVHQLGDDFVGLALHETARVTAAGHGGQVLLSAAAAELVRSSLPAGTGLTDLGEHRLKDLTQPVRIFQLTGDGLRTDFPPLRTLEAVGARLPVQVTSFVGRAEVEKVAHLLGGTRLLTLTGPGGTGKTRLSIEVAADVAPRFADGTFFVALDSVTDPQLVASEIATVLGLAAGSEEPIDRVLAYLADRSALLVLDNMEQVTDARDTVARLLATCPRVAVIVTSRIPLRIRGEQEFPVPALSLPTGPSPDSTAAAASEAVKLFVERAMAARPDFSLTDENAPAIADIVNQLDGLPLAIELAAARVRMLPVEALRRRLGDRLTLLTGGARDLPERQQTLRGAIEWSHDLLDDPDRRLFARFSVIAGGARYDQTERVCGPAEELGREVFDGLDSLSQQSLLRVGEDGGEPRYAMLVTIREFAAERLEDSTDAITTHRRHAESFLQLAEEAQPHLLGDQAADWNDRLEREHDNLRAALAWTIADDEPELGLRLVIALWRFWQVRGHLDEASERIEAVLSMPSVASQPPELRARAHSAAGGIAYWRSDARATHRHYAQALALARESGDRHLLADALYDAGFAPLPEPGSQAERMRAGGASMREALELYRELGDEAGIARSLWALSMSVAADGDVATAMTYAEESLEMSRRRGDRFQAGWAAHMVGLGSLYLDRVAVAARHFGESFETWVAAGDRSGITLLVFDLALLAKKRAAHERRWRLMGAAEKLRVETGTDIVNEQVDFLGWEKIDDPTEGDELRWFEEGRRLDLDEIVDLARSEVRDAAAAPD